MSAPPKKFKKIDSRSFSEDPAVLPGVIETIHLKNFMCHSNLRFEFGPHLNFITGQNGSGKSAVLAAVVIGLGAKAGSLSRYASAKEYIKNDCNAAEIIVTLHNTGSDAFEPEIFGRRIVVERKISKAGGGSYKMKSESGAVVYEKRDHVSRMMQHFNIQLENPVTMLTQDVSRQFLQSMKPNRLYDLFYCGTQLEKMYNDLAAVGQNISVAERTVNNRRSHLPRLATEVDELKNRLLRHSSLQNFRERIENLINEHAWVKVIARERAIKTYEQNLATISDTLSKANQEISSKEAEIENFQQNIANVTARIADFDQNHEQNRRTYENAEAEFSAVKRNVQAVEDSIRRTKQKISLTNNEKEQLMNALNEFNSQYAGDRNAKIAEKRNLVQSLQQKIDINKEKLNTIEQAAQKLNNDALKVKTRRMELKERLRATESNISRLSRRLQDLQASKSDKLARFGQHTPNLLRMINKEKSFNKKPRGPLAAEISIVDESWAVAIENCLGFQILSSYICDSFHDSKILERLMEDTGVKARPSIITSKFFDVRHDISRNVPRSMHPTVLSQLNIQDPVIFNAIVDQTNAESIILIKDDRTMRELMNKNPPCSKSYAASGACCMVKPTFRYYPPNERPTNLLSSSVEDSIANIERELAEYRAQEAAIRIEDVETLQTLNKQSNEIAKYSCSTNDLKNANDRYSRDLRNTEEDLSSLTVQENNACNQDFERDITEYSNQLRELEANLKEYQIKHQDLVEQLKQSSIMKNEARMNYEGMRGDKASLSEQLQVLQKGIVRKTREIETLNGVKADLSHKSERHKCGKQEAEDHLKACLEEAKSVGERVDTERTAEVIEAELARVQRQLKAGEEEIGDIETLKEQYDEKLNLLQCMKKELKSAQSSLDKMKASYRLRNQMIVAMKSRLTISLKYNFICNLQIQKFGGKLIIDHESRSIQIKVSKDSSSVDASSSSSADRKSVSNATFRDLRGLSGGERSFTTVSFILAMWRLMEVPFRFLDEFDVFMDAENRRIATQMFMDLKNGNAIRSQLALLTPTDLEVLRKNPENVRIFELQAPRDNADHGKSRKKRRLDDVDSE